MGIKILLEKGPKPRKGAGGIVLANMEDIDRARGLGWGWNEIAKELGVESSGAVRKAYMRIKKRIDAGKLKLSSSGAVSGPKGIPSPSKATGTSPPKKTFSKVGEKQKEETEKGDFDFQSLPQI